MSGAEILLILVVGVIVIGPKRLPGMMRTLGRWIARARRTIFEVRANTGIDKLIREEGLENEIREISSLTRSNVLSTLVTNNPVAAATRSISGALSAPLPAPPPKKAVVTELAPSSAAAPSSGTDGASTAAKIAPEVSPAEPAQMVGPTPNAAALSLIKPAAGNVSRRDEDVLRLLMRAATGSTRDREYPTIGCDAYDVMPDDIDDPEAYTDEPPELDGAPAPEELAAAKPEAPEEPEIERAV
ncbi:MAG: twin-arginine translocase TatA/TatE family subunit [Polyangiaceae bacterium]